MEPKFGEKVECYHKAKKQADTMALLIGMLIGSVPLIAIIEYYDNLESYSLFSVLFFFVSLFGGFWIVQKIGQALVWLISIPILKWRYSVQLKKLKNNYENY